MATTPKWWTEDTVALVTGANKGIGYEIVRAFATEGLRVVLTARDPAKGQAAVDELKAAGLKNIYFHKLEVSSPESVKTLATWLKEKFGGLDILVNNAGAVGGSAPGLDGVKVTYENAKEIIDINYFGVKNVTEGLLPVFRASPAGARIVNATSRVGLYERLKGPLLETFRDEDNYSKKLADSLATKYIEDVKKGKFVEEGWLPEEKGKLPMYCESKMIENVYSIALAKSLAKVQPEQHQIYVTSFCPGTTQTTMYARGAEDGGFEAPSGFQLKTPADGADTGVWLALLPKEEIVDKVGKFYGERTEYLFGWKNPPFA
ncbi:unnamed protein product [Calypogeia fissa]